MPVVVVDGAHHAGVHGHQGNAVGHLEEEDQGDNLLFVFVEAGADKEPARVNEEDDDEEGDAFEEEGGEVDHHPGFRVACDRRTRTGTT